MHRTFLGALAVMGLLALAFSSSLSNAEQSTVEAEVSAAEDDQACYRADGDRHNVLGQQGRRRWSASAMAHSAPVIEMFCAAGKLRGAPHRG